MSAAVLTRGSSGKELREFFSAVAEREERGNGFPADLDSVWRLAGYAHREDAAWDLRANYAEGVDYLCFGQDAPGGADYYLSVPCMEFFALRKWRAAFDTYRDVFRQRRKKQAAQRLPIADKLLWARAAKELLALDAEAMWSLMERIAEAEGLPMPERKAAEEPEREKEEGQELLPAAELLARSGVKMSARSFNERLKRTGLLQERKAEGKARGAWELSEAGKAYARQEERYVRIPTPSIRWRADRFAALLDLLGIAHGEGGKEARP